MIRPGTIKKWHAGELAPYAFSRYFVRKVREVEETGIVEGEFLRLNSLLMNEKSKMFEEFDEKIAGMMRDIYPVQITLDPKKNKKSSEPLSVDDIKNAALLMFESLKNVVLLDQDSLELRVVHGTDKDTGDVTMTTFVFEEDEDVVPWTKALAEMSYYKQVDSDALEEFFLHRLPEA